MSAFHFQPLQSPSRAALTLLVAAIIAIALVVAIAPALPAVHHATVATSVAPASNAGYGLVP